MLPVSPSPGVPPMSTSPKLIPPAAFGASERIAGGAIDVEPGGRTDRRRSSSSRSLKSAGSTGGPLDDAARARGELGGDSCGKSISPKRPNADSAAFWPGEGACAVAGGYESPTVGSSISPNPRPPPAAGTGRLSSGTGSAAAVDGRFARASEGAGRDAATDGRFAVTPPAPLPPARTGSEGATTGKFERGPVEAGSDRAPTGRPAPARAGR